MAKPTSPPEETDDNDPTLEALAAKLGKPEPGLLEALLDGATEARLVERGRQIASSRVLTDMRRLCATAHACWSGASKDKREKLRGFSPELRALGAIELPDREPRLARLRISPLLEGRWYSPGRRPGPAPAPQPRKPQAVPVPADRPRSAALFALGSRAARHAARAFVHTTPENTPPAPASRSGRPALSTVQISTSPWNPSC